MTLLLAIAAVVGLTVLFARIFRSVRDAELLRDPDPQPVELVPPTTLWEGAGWLLVGGGALVLAMVFLLLLP